MITEQFFKRLAPTLAENGYLPIPLKPGAKAALVKNWPHYRYAAGDEAKYAACGVGLLCGRGEFPLGAIDVDSKCEELLRWVEQAIDHHIVLARYGDAPKVLYPVLLPKEGLGKMSSARFEDEAGNTHQLEVLGAGQQFVAFGIHPKTQAPYAWGQPWDIAEYSPATVKASELATVSVEFLQKLISDFEQQCKSRGWTQKSRTAVATAMRETPDPLEDAMSRLPDVDIRKAREYLLNLSAEDYNQWVLVGQALKHQFEASDEAYRLWDEWSQSAATYPGAAETAEKWATFDKNDSVRPVTMRTLIKLANDERQRSEKAARRAAFDMLAEQVRQCEDAYDLRAIAEKAALTEAEDRAAFVMLVKNRRKELTGESLDRRIIAAWLPAVNVGGYHLTEEGNACRMVDRYKGGFRYVAQTGEWLIWTGTYWRKTAEAEIRALARKTIDAIYKEAEEAASQESQDLLRKWATRSSTAYMYDAMTRIAQTMEGVYTNAEELDADPRYFGVANGEIDLYTGEFSAGKPSHLITRQSKAAFDENATCPLWDKKLLEILGSSERVAFYYRLRGYGLLGNPKEHKLPIYFGNGANGKSTIVNIEQLIAGSYAVTASPETFVGGGIDGGAGRAREDLVKLAGARCVYVNEPDEGVLKEGIVKALTGQDRITARAPYAKSSITFTPACVITMVTNHQPIIKDSGDGIWRRITGIEFDRKFLGADMDTRLGEKLRGELSGILNRFLAGVRDYLKVDGLEIPQDVQKTNEAYREDMDLLRDWLSECCEFGPAFKETTGDLFASWKAYAQNRGEFAYVSTARSLGRNLTSRGLKNFKDGKGSRGFLGLRLKRFDDLGGKNESE